MDKKKQQPEFDRDVDRLLLQYRNLRNSMYLQYNRALTGEASKKELESYIDEQFIRLVKEYDINGEVDFPMYVKTKLQGRVGRVFINRKRRDKSREILPGIDDSVKYSLENRSYEDTTDVELYDLMQHTFPHELTEVEQVILDEWLNRTANTNIVRKLYTDYNPEKKTLKEMDLKVRNFEKVIRARIEEYQKQV